MPVGIPSSLARQARSALRPLLQHRYTRVEPDVPVLDEGVPVEDAWGNPVVEDGTPVSDLPCLYQSARRRLIRESDTIVLDIMTLTVYHDDPIQSGWRVTNVTDQDGTVLVASAVVDAYDPAAEAGASVFKICTLTSVVTP